MATRVLILLSDGSDTASRMAPAKAAAIAKQNGVVIHTIVVGDPAATSDMERVDEATLRAVADATAGSFHRTGDTEGLAEVYAQIDAVGARTGATISWRPRISITAIPAGLAAALVVVAYALVLLRHRLRRLSEVRT